MYYVKVKPSEVSEVTKLFKRLFKVYLEECKDMGEREGGRRMTIKFGCNFVKCVTSGDGFEKGVIYPVLGNNNGINIVREKWAGRTNDPGGDSSDPYIFYACTGGIGEGIFNNFDNSGKPSFDPWPSEE